MGFFYECAECKAKIPATFERPTDVRTVTVVAKNGTETVSFRCEECFAKTIKD